MGWSSAIRRVSSLPADIPTSARTSSAKREPFALHAKATKCTTRRERGAPPEIVQIETSKGRHHLRRNKRLCRRSSRTGKLENAAFHAVESTLTAIMAREAIYSGKPMTWSDLKSTVIVRSSEGKLAATLEGPPPEWRVDRKVAPSLVEVAILLPNRIFSTTITCKAFPTCTCKIYSWPPLRRF